MAIEQDTYFKVVCDQCGEAFPEHDSGGFTLFESEDEARFEISCVDGETTDDGKVLCGECAYEKRTDEALSDQPGEESSRG